MRNLPEDLPDCPSIPGIAMLIGMEQAARISSELGGLKLYIPKNPGEHSVLSAIIGVEDARSVAEIWGGLEFLVPISVGKHAEAVAMLQAGEGVSTIVRKLRCSRKFVYGIKYKLEKEQQLDLFSPPPALP